MDRWDDLRYLVAVHKTGTMSGAAKLLGANVGTVSRRIERLGEELGVPPFVKTPQGWTSNPEMATLIEAAITFENQIKSALSTVGDKAEQQPVHLRINCPPVVSGLLLFPRLGELRRAMPQVRITLSQSILINTLGDHDMIITPQRPDKGRLLTRGVGKLDVALYGPAQGPTPSDWVGLSEDHDDNPAMQMAFARFGRPPMLRVDNLSLVADALRQSGLAGTVPVMVGEQMPGLRRLDPEQPPAGLSIWLCYHESRRGDRILGAVMDWVLDCFAANRRIQAGN